MALFRLEEFNPDYREELFDGEDFKGIAVFAEGSSKKIGRLHDALVDDAGYSQYFVIETGFWILGKQVLLPVDYCYVDVKAKRIYALGLTEKKQVENLPKYNHRILVDDKYEEQVRRVYRLLALQPLAPLAGSSFTNSSSLETVERSLIREYSFTPQTATYKQNLDRNQQEAYLQEKQQRDQQLFKLYEERLVADKNRQRIGEVIVGKHVETEVAQASIPITKERVVIERTPLENFASSRVTPGSNDFQNQEVVHMEIYEEIPEVHKQAFVREEIKIKKEINQETIDIETPLRRETLELHSEGNPTVKSKKLN